MIAVLALYAVMGENSYIAIHDNLDLFTPQFRMMKATGTFFGQGASVPFLHGISRDALPSELSFYTLLYVLLPAFPAYVVGYVFKIGIAILGATFLAKDFAIHGTLLAMQGGGHHDSGSVTSSVPKVSYFSGGDNYSDADGADVKRLAWLCGFAYGILNLFPCFGIPFASIPLAVWIFRNIYRNPSPKWYVAAFCYPFISYFSYFGFFLCAYVLVAVVWLWIRDGARLKRNGEIRQKRGNVLGKAFPKSLFLGLVLLALGCVFFEYRLFRMMLFDDTQSIRTTMVLADLNIGDALRESLDVFLHGSMHTEDAHLYFVLPICLIYFVFLNVRYIVKGNIKGIFHDLYNLCALILVFNCLVYGLYDNGGVRNLFETLIPPLTGFQFNRTEFFNPFLWYSMLFLVSYRICFAGGRLLENSRMKFKGRLMHSIGILLPVIAVFVILLTPSRYNDLYHTAYGAVYSTLHDGASVDTMNWRELYSEELFDDIKSDIDYQDGDWSVAYGMYPAVLQYNGIATLDGYLGYYSQEYKEQFRKVIAPALDRVPASQAYFDNWGARCYLYSGTDEVVQLYTKSLYGLTDTNLYVDVDALRDLDCRYIFSRVRFGNADELGITEVGAYSRDDLPYTVYVYEIPSL